MKFPTDEKAEKEILASALFKKDVLYSLLESNNIFYNNQHRVIFNAMSELNNLNENVDLSTLRIYLNDEKFDPLLTELAQCSLIFNHKFVIRELELKSCQRDLMLNAQDLFKSCQAGSIQYQEFIDKIIEINDLINRPARSECITMEEMTDQNLDDIFKITDFIKTGLYGLDSKIIGLFKTQLIVIAAAPGLGKTTLAWNLACNINDSLFVSYEMQRNELYAKLLSRYSGVNSLKIEGKTLNEVELIEVLRAIDQIKKTIKLTLFDYSLPFCRLMSAIRKVCKQKKINAIFIDYLQLIEGAHGENREERISNVTRSLKLLAGELKTPIILLSQLTKDVMKEGRAPTLGDIRGSGAIVQDADVVIFLYDEDEKTVLNVAKGRKGTLGTVTGIDFQKNYSRFVDIDDRHEYQGSFYETEKNNQ